MQLVQLSYCRVAPPAVDDKRVVAEWQQQPGHVAGDRERATLVQRLPVRVPAVEPRGGVDTSPPLVKLAISTTAEGHSA